jgi:hypothetical protein
LNRNSKDDNGLEDKCIVPWLFAWLPIMDDNVKPEDETIDNTDKNTVVSKMIMD